MGCVPHVGGWDTRNLKTLYPGAANIAGQRLADTPPYFAIAGDRAWLFLCRFATDEPIDVAFPPDADARERGAIELALKGWSAAGLGVRFRAVETTTQGITIRFAQAIGDSTVKRAGYAASECGLDWSKMPIDDANAPMPARLLRAEIVLRRSHTDIGGNKIALSDDEFVGTALHELGHALGFAGHVATDRSIMTRSTDRVRRFGRELRAAGTLAAPTLLALYTLPSGARLGEWSVSKNAAGLFRKAKFYAAERGWSGPRIRVGERNASLVWFDDKGIVAALTIEGYAAALRAGRPIEFSPSAFASRLRLTSH